MFIELTAANNGRKELFNLSRIDNITTVSDTDNRAVIYYGLGSSICSMTVKESYEEVKTRINYARIG